MPDCVKGRNHTKKTGTTICLVVPTEDGTSLDEFYIDFKRLFTVPVDYVYATAAIGVMQWHGFLSPNPPIEGVSRQGG